jgi:hypothetical protein
MAFSRAERRRRRRAPQVRNKVARGECERSAHAAPGNSYHSEPALKGRQTRRTTHLCRPSGPAISPYDDPGVTLRSTPGYLIPRLRRSARLLPSIRSPDYGRLRRSARLLPSIALPRLRTLAALGATVFFDPLPALTNVFGAHPWLPDYAVGRLRRCGTRRARELGLMALNLPGSEKRRLAINDC